MKNVKQIVYCLTILSLGLAVVKAESEGYVVGNFTTKFECVPLPKNEVCTGDILVFKQSAASFQPESFKQIKLSVEKKVINQSCYDAIIKSACISLGRCTPTKLSIDIPAAVSSCKKVGESCPPSFSSSVANNCSNTDMYNYLNTEAPKCAVVEDKTGLCPSFDYKLPFSPSFNYAKQFMETKAQVEALKAKLSGECYKSLKKLGCLLTAKACSSDQKYILSLVSKQDCLESIKCAPEALNISKYCDDLPDGNTAKKMPVLSNPSNGASFTQQAISVILTAITCSLMLFK